MRPDNPDTTNDQSERIWLLEHVIPLNYGIDREVHRFAFRDHRSALEEMQQRVDAYNALGYGYHIQIVHDTATGRARTAVAYTGTWMIGMVVSLTLEPVDLR